MRLDKQHPLPVYLQLKEMLRDQIEQGAYRSHQKLPSERDLCQHYNLSRMTARRALQELIDEGFAYTRVGKGTFVSYRPNNPVKVPATIGDTPRSIDLGSLTKAHYQQKLLDQLLAFSCVGAERVISELLATYPLETVALKLFPEVIRQIEKRWLSGHASLSAQNYAITTLCSKLIAMVNATAPAEAGPKVLLACAPEDRHEIGLLLLALSLRRRGCRVIYLGPNVSTNEFYQVIEAVQPELICFSAATRESGRALATLSRQLPVKKRDNRWCVGQIPFTFGGVAFSQEASLIPEVSGSYLADTIEGAVIRIQELLSL